ncbi:hypothetical protein D770_21095 [Flammeovirgaceae bacterium 311]|nr:hypothetical protein D770_21095 [Flammeovirgaceae bacterium 311]
MPPKPKRLPPPALQHLKHSRQLLEDFLYQYLPQLSSLGSISRINVFTWFSGKWGLTPDASGGLPYMLLEALRQQRQHLLTQKAALKPLSLSLFSSPEDTLPAKALPLLQEQNSQSHTAKISHYSLSWKEVVKELQTLLQRQPASERNLLILDPLDLQLPGLKELLLLLPKRLDILLVLPAASILQAGGITQKKEPAKEMLLLSGLLSPLLPAPPEEGAEEKDEKTLPSLFQELKQGLATGSNRFVMHSTPAAPEQHICLYGLSHDALMMERMLLARQKLRKILLDNLQAGNQLGLFGSPASGERTASAANNDAVTLLLGREQEWDNQALYLALLKEEILPQEAVQVLQQLMDAGRLEVLDEKKKKLKSPGPIPLSHTAYKLPAPSRYFRLKQP